MKPGGDAILNGDDERVRVLSGVSGKQWRVSLDDESAEIYGSDVSYGKEGVRLTVRDDTGETAEIKAKLLGQHNVINLLIGVAVARSYGLRLRQIAAAASRIEPTDHRLALREEAGLTVIDDAFNSNPVGARNAVEILGQMDGKRVIVTPGMVEFGDRQYDENKIFGTHIARHADLAILVGQEQTRPIQDGLREAGYPDDQIAVVRHVVRSPRRRPRPHQARRHRPLRKRPTGSVQWIVYIGANLLLPCVFLFYFFSPHRFSPAATPARLSGWVVTTTKMSC